MRLLLPIILLATACSTPDATVIDPPPTAAMEPIQVSMSLYVVDEVPNGEDSSRSSQRQVTEIEDIAARMNDIWVQAGIELIIGTVTRIEVSASILDDLSAGDTSSFLRAASAGEIDIPGPGIINGFYVRQVGAANGVAPFGSRVFFVTDDPSVHDERVSSHEVGHILGLHHDLESSSRLMFSGTNGMDLTAEQITTARYAAAGILDGVR